MKNDGYTAKYFHNDDVAAGLLYHVLRSGAVCAVLVQLPRAEK
jgi:hypothetical protein